MSTAKKKKNRADIPVPSVDPMANAWEKGEVKQLIITGNADSALHKHYGVMKKMR